MHRAAIAVTALAALPLVGCVVIPLPPVGAQIGREEIRSLQPGVSTRADVHDRLGEPSQLVTNRYEIFNVSKETAHVLVAVLFYAGGVERVGAQDFRVLAEYGPGGVLQSLYWEGMVEDTDALEGRSYISSAAPATGPGAVAESPINPNPILSWPAPTATAYPVEAAAVTVSPEEPIVAISYGNVLRLVQITLRNWQTGAVLAQTDQAPGGCPRLVSPATMRMPTIFLSDGRHLASAADEALVCVWDSQTLRQVLTFRQHWKPRAAFGLAAGNRLISMATARSAPIVATADAGNVIRVWNGLSGLELAVIEPCSSGPGCGSWVASSIGRLALSDDGRVLATFQSGDHEDAVRLWDTSAGAELGSLATPAKTTPRFASLVNLALSPDTRHLALHMGDHVEIWRIDQAPPPTSTAGQLERRFELERIFILPPVYIDLPTSGPAETHQLVRSLDFSSDGVRLLAGDGVAILWNTEDWRELWRADVGSRDLWPAMSSRFVQLGLTADGRRLVTACCVWVLPDPVISLSDIP